MREKGSGAIVNIVAGSGSSLGKEAGAYHASMAGLVALSHQADHELSPFGIRVYAVENSADVVKNLIGILEAQ